MALKDVLAIGGGHLPGYKSVPGDWIEKRLLSTSSESVKIADALRSGQTVLALMAEIKIMASSREIAAIEQSYRRLPSCYY